MSTKHIQRTFEEVGEVMKEKESEWEYQLPALREEVACIALSCDGTTAPLRDEGFKEVMVGNISFYNSAGERLDSIYTACAPEKGKQTFEAIFAQEIEEVKNHYPKAYYLGLALPGTTNGRAIDGFLPCANLSDGCCRGHVQEKRRQKNMDGQGRPHLEARGKRCRQHIKRG